MSVDYGSEPTWKEFDCNIISKTKRRIALAVDRHTTLERLMNHNRRRQTDRLASINKNERDKHTDG